MNQFPVSLIENDPSKTCTAQSRCDDNGERPESRKRRARNEKSSTSSSTSKIGIAYYSSALKDSSLSDPQLDR